MTPARIFILGVGIRRVIALVDPRLPDMILAWSGVEDSLVKKSRKAAFEPKTFLAKVGDGKTITEYQKDQVVFSQGGEADAVFYIQKGKINSPSFPSGARKQS